MLEARRAGTGKGCSQVRNPLLSSIRMREVVRLRWMSTILLFGQDPGATFWEALEGARSHVDVLICYLSIC